MQARVNSKLRFLREEVVGLTRTQKTIRASDLIVAPFPPETLGKRTRSARSHNLELSSRTMRGDLMPDDTNRPGQNTFQSRPTTPATASPHPATAPHVRPGAAKPADSARVIARIAKPKAGPASSNEAQTTSKATSK